MASTKNHIELGVWQVTEESVRDYLSAVGDDNTAYDELGLAPSLALAAHALAVMLDKLSLPPGAIHSLQEVETLKPVPYGTQVVCSATVEPPRRRGQLQFITVGFTLTDGAGDEVVAGKTTVLVTGHEP